MNRDTPIHLSVGNTIVALDGPHNDLALFVSLGAALAEVQSFEVLITGLLHTLMEKKSSSEGEKRLIEELYRETLGKLSRLFQERLPNDKLSAVLKNVVERRNFLVHDFLKKYGWPMMSDSDYLKAIREAQEIRVLLKKAHSEATAYLSNQKVLDVLTFSLDPITGEFRQVVP